MNLHKSIKVSFQKGQAFEAGAAPGGLPFVQGAKQTWQGLGRALAGPWQLGSAAVASLNLLISEH
jgi:hypothetical protein